MKLFIARSYCLSLASLFLSYSLACQASAVAPVSVAMSPGEQFEQLANDLYSYPNFFEEGQEQFEREVQRLQQEQIDSSEPSLKIDTNLQGEIEQLPQLQPNDFPAQSQAE